MLRRVKDGLLRGGLEGQRAGAGQPQGWGLSGAGALSYSLAAHRAASPSGTACKPEALFQGTEGAEPGEGGLAPGTAQQPRVHGVALPGLGRAKGWSFDGKREVRGAQAPTVPMDPCLPSLPSPIPAGPAERFCGVRRCELQVCSFHTLACHESPGRSPYCPEPLLPCQAGSHKILTSGAPFLKLW